MNASGKSKFPWISVPCTHSRLYSENFGDFLGILSTFQGKIPHLKKLEEGSWMPGEQEKENVKKNKALLNSFSLKNHIFLEF